MAHLCESRYSFSHSCSSLKIAYAGSLILRSVFGGEEVNNDVFGNAYLVNGLYPLESGITVGAAAQYGAIDSACSDRVPEENRFEAIAAYTITLTDSSISPCFFIDKV